MTGAIRRRRLYERCKDSRPPRPSACAGPPPSSVFAHAVPLDHRRPPGQALSLVGRGVRDQSRDRGFWNPVPVRLPLARGRPVRPRERARLSPRGRAERKPPRALPAVLVVPAGSGAGDRGAWRRGGIDHRVLAGDRECVSCALDAAALWGPASCSRRPRPKSSDPTGLRDSSSVDLPALKRIEFEAVLLRGAPSLDPRLAPALR